jgi:hypothetical protein
MTTGGHVYPFRVPCRFGERATSCWISFARSILNASYADSEGYHPPH